MIVVNIVISFALIVFFLIYRYLFPKKSINLFFLLLIISILPVISILRKGNYESGDLALHSAFLVDFFSNLKEGILNPQWTAGLCGGYGCPLFIFQYTMPYYIASLFYFIGFSFLESTKYTLIFAFISSGIGIYLWTKEEFNEKAAFVASLLYLFSPYHLMDMHFRVSVGEVMSFTFIPFIFLFCKKVIETRKLHYVFLWGLSFLMLVLSHSSTTAVIIPLSIAYSFLVWKRKRNNNYLDIIYMVSTFIYGFLLSAYYLLPALLEYRYTWYSQSLTIGDFKPLNEYLYSPAIFGLLFQGHHGELRLIVGYAQLIVVFASIILLLKNKFSKKEKPLLLLWLICFFFLFLMMQGLSEPIWKAVPILKTFCIPWRLLVPISLITSAIGGLVVKKMTNKYLIAGFCLFVIFSTILNWGNRRMVPEDKNSYFTAQGIVLYTEFYDPLSKILRERYSGCQDVPQKCLKRSTSSIDVLNGKADIFELQRSIIKHEYLIRVESDANIKENTFYFPGWKLFVNNKPHEIDYKNPNFPSIITFKLNKGLYKVELKFVDTPVREISKHATQIALLILIFAIIVNTYQTFYSKFAPKPTRRRH